MQKARKRFAEEKAARETKKTVHLLDSLRSEQDCSTTNPSFESQTLGNLLETVPRVNVSEIVHSQTHHSSESGGLLEDSTFRDGDSAGRPRLSAGGFSFRESSPDLPRVSSGSDVVTPEKSFRDALRQWAVEHNIKRNALTGLLKLLKSQAELSQLDLPRDARTLLGTPCTESKYPVTVLQPGEYCHFGLAAGLRHSLRAVKQLPGVVSLTVNVDGLPLAKSSKMQLWPIQCQVSNCDGDPSPFVIGAYAGPSKPLSSNDFLRPFVDELQHLLSYGLVVNNQKIELRLKALVRDAPARSFIMMSKGHSGYSGCPKCTVEGSYVEGKVVFLDSDSPLRTDESFREQHDPEHHRGASILLELLIDST